MEAGTGAAAFNHRESPQPLRYGRFPLPIALENGAVRLSALREGHMVHYRREGPSGTAEKTLLTGGGRLIVNPVEPVNLPQAISTAFMVHLAKQVVVEPKKRALFFLTFPIEVGVFIAGQQAVEMLDVFSLQPSKFALYGPPAGGRVCRYWRSEVHFALCEVDPLHQGVLELTAHNTTPRWVEVSRVVFNAHGMKLFFSADLVAMRAEMKITAPDMAETQFLDQPLHAGMKKALEVYRARKLSIATAKFVMEYGL